MTREDAWATLRKNAAGAQARRQDQGASTPGRTGDALAPPVRCADVTVSDPENTDLVSATRKNAINAATMLTDRSALIRARIADADLYIVSGYYHLNGRVEWLELIDEGGASSLA